MKTNPCCLPSDYKTTNIFSCLSCDFQHIIICLFRYLLPLDFFHLSAIESRTNPLKVNITLITLNLSPSGCWLRWPVSPILAGIETCHFTVCPGPVPESLRGGNTFYIGIFRILFPNLCFTGAVATHSWRGYTFFLGRNFEVMIVSYSQQQH